MTKAHSGERGHTEGKPDDIPKRVWDEAFDYAAAAKANPRCTQDAIARAILAAEQREREEAASYHDDLAAQHEAFRHEAKGDLISHHTKMVRLHQGYAAAIRSRGEAK